METKTNKHRLINKSVSKLLKITPNNAIIPASILKRYILVVLWFHFFHITLYSKQNTAIELAYKKIKSEAIFEEIEKPLIPIIKKMEERGVLIDSVFLQKLNNIL